MLKRFQLIFLWTSLVTLLIIGTIPAVVKAQRIPPDQGRARVYPSSVEWTTEDAPGTNGSRPFTLWVQMCNVTNGTGATVSLWFNASLFQLYPQWLGDAGMWWDADAYAIKYSIGDLDNTPPDGYLKDAAMVQLGPNNESAKTYGDGDWGYHIRLKFTYVGPDPEFGKPIESDIIILDNEAIGAPTYWKQFEVGNKTFLDMKNCHFSFTVSKQKLTFPAIGGDGKTYNVTIETNSSVSDFAFNATYAVGALRGETSFNVNGTECTNGFCNVTIPKNLTIGVPWLILVDGSPPSPDFIQSGNATHTFLYFTYHHASPSLIQIYGTWVVPEFPSAIILPLFMTLSLITAVFFKHKKKKQ